MSEVLERWAVVGDGTKESRRLIPMKDDGRDPVELYDALQKADEFLNEIDAIMGRIEPRLEIVDVGVILMSTQLEQADERIVELEKTLQTVEDHGLLAVVNQLESRITELQNELSDGEQDG